MKVLGYILWANQRGAETVLVWRMWLGTRQMSVNRRKAMQENSIKCSGLWMSRAEKWIGARKNWRDRGSLHGKMGLKLDWAGFIGVRNVVRKEKVRVRRPGTELTAASFGRNSIALQTSPLFIRLATASNLHSLERRLILETTRDPNLNTVESEMG